MAKRRYLVLARNQSAGGEHTPSPEQMQQMFAAYKAWMEKFKDDILDVGDKLRPDGRLVTASGATDGPFTETKEVVGGYMIVSAENYDAAVKIVSACPAVHAAGACLEIRETVGARM
jgi:hypothetical protein